MKREGTRNMCFFFTWPYGTTIAGQNSGNKMLKMSQKIRAVNKACDWSIPILDMD